MRIAISSGHSTKCQGAIGVLNEVEEATRVVDRVYEIWQENGIECWKFHDTISNDSSENLNRIVDWHNALPEHDLDVSCHFNAGGGTGTEVLYVTQEELAEIVSAAIAEAADWTDRGPKYRSDLFFLNSTERPSILLEICFVDSEADADRYRERFEDICRATASSIVGQEMTPPEEGAGLPELPTVPPFPDRPERPTEQPPPTQSQRPTIGRGDSGSHVVTVQQCLQAPVDGDFGSITEQAVADYQREKQIQADGIVGPQTWSWLEWEFSLPVYPPPMLPPLSDEQTAAICAIADDSEIAEYYWDDRGQAPVGYIEGMAYAFADMVRRLHAGDSTAVELARANTGDNEIDVLAWYEDEFDELGMENDRWGVDTLRHLFALMIGLGMRESSGQHCCGRDQSADNTDAMTCEAGLFQMSWNASSCSEDMQKLFDEYNSCPSPQCGLQIFSRDVSCSNDDWQNYGSGDGEHYQMMAKNCPVFAVHTAAICLRKRRQHFGPINRMEVELRLEADAMLQDVQRYLFAEEIV